MDGDASWKERLGRLAVLVVDDHRINREWLHAGLRHRVARIELAGSGEAAIERCRQKAFDVVLMDLHLPGMDGGATADSIRELAGPSSRARLIAVTADARESTREGLLRRGFDASLSKPVGLESIVATLEQVFAPERPAPHPAGDAGSAALVDHERARRAANGDDGLVDRLQGMLAAEILARRPEIEHSLLRADRAGAAELLHQWIGACGYAGATRLARDCQAMRDALGGDSRPALADACLRFLRTAEATRTRLQRH